MGCVLQCLVKMCCDDERRRRNHQLAGDESSPSNNVQEGMPVSARHIVGRGGESQQQLAGGYEIAPQGSTDEEDIRQQQQQQLQEPLEPRVNDNAENGDDFDPVDCCRGGSSSAPTPTTRLKEADDEGGLHPQIRGIREFFQRVRDRWRRYDLLEPANHAPRDRTETFASDVSMDVTSSNNHNNLVDVAPPKSSKGTSLPPPSPLRTAKTFERGEIPSIHATEVVYPGSLLQKEMALAMSLTLEKQDDECVICMEGFEPDNPRMPTLCGCGENKTYFHLPCLYQWVEHCRECPSCRQTLRWEEF